LLRKRANDYADLLNSSDDLSKFRDLIFKESKPFDLLEDNETLFHVLIKSKVIDNNLKNKYIYVLSDVGIDINYQNKFNKTCLHLAVSSGMISVINTLLQCSSDLTIVDNVSKYIIDNIFNLNLKL
jgi:ankyrin repeat protein